MMSSALRATVSNGFKRPVESTGISPNFLKSNAPGAAFGIRKLDAIETMVRIMTIQGKKRFILREGVSFAA